MIGQTFVYDFLWLLLRGHASTQFPGSAGYSEAKATVDGRTPA